jgi:hypothetical protein
MGISGIFIAAFGEHVIGIERKGMAAWMEGEGGCWVMVEIEDGVRIAK